MLAQKLCGSRLDWLPNLHAAVHRHRAVRNPPRIGGRRRQPASASGRSRGAARLHPLGPRQSAHHGLVPGWRLMMDRLGGFSSACGPASRRPALGSLLAGAGAFPSSGPPRALWLGVAARRRLPSCDSPGAGGPASAARVRAGAAAVCAASHPRACEGHPPRRRRWRCGGPWRTSRFPAGGGEIGHVTLFRSQPSPTVTVYVRLASTIELMGSEHPRAILRARCRLRSCSPGARGSTSASPAAATSAPRT